MSASRSKLQELVARLGLIESLALIPRVRSTNFIAKKVVDECLDNDIPLPSAMIIAGEQLNGRGREARQWYSPAGKGIYSTILHSRSAADLPLIPMEIANTVASFLREKYGVEAQIKWPNDILVAGKKIAGILIEARAHEGQLYMLIGIGINIHAMGSEAPAGSTSLAEVTGEQTTDLEAVTFSFVEHVDRRLASPFEKERVFREWNEQTAHKKGDQVMSVVSDRKVEGSWQGIDDSGSAVIRTTGGEVKISAGDLIMLEPVSTADETQ